MIKVFTTSLGAEFVGDTRTLYERLDNLKASAREFASQQPEYCVELVFGQEHILVSFNAKVVMNHQDLQVQVLTKDDVLNEFIKDAKEVGWFFLNGKYIRVDQLTQIIPPEQFRRDPPKVT